MLDWAPLCREQNLDLSIDAKGGIVPSKAIVDGLSP